MKKLVFLLIIILFSFSIVFALSLRDITVNTKGSGFWDNFRRFFGVSSESGTTTIPETHDIPVLVLKYFPDEDNDGRLDEDITGVNYEIGWIRDRLAEVNSRIINALEKGSAYHGYKDASAEPSLNYYILEDKEFIRPVPKLEGSGARPPNHTKILTDEGFNICDYVENHGLKEVWLWMYHTDEIYPVESYQRGSYGGLGNGYMNLPLCANTYTVYDYNFAVGNEPFAENKPLHNHMHHLESVFGWIDEDIFLNKFAAVKYHCCPWMPDWIGSERRCGNCHNPPNSKADYGYWYEDYVESDCEDWTPDGGAKKYINCRTWGEYQGCISCTDTHYDRACTEAAYYIWWMQNIPGKNNDLYFEGKKLRNWWDFVGDFDQAMEIGKSLVYDYTTTTSTTIPSITTSTTTTTVPITTTSTTTTSTTTTSTTSTTTSSSTTTTQPSQTIIHDIVSDEGDGNTDASYILIGENTANQNYMSIWGFVPKETGYIDQIQFNVANVYPSIIGDVPDFTVNIKIKEESVVNAGYGTGTIVATWYPKNDWSIGWKTIQTSEYLVKKGIPYTLKFQTIGSDNDGKAESMKLYEDTSSTNPIHSKTSLQVNPGGYGNIKFRIQVVPETTTTSTTSTTTTSSITPTTVPTTTTIPSTTTSITTTTTTSITSTTQPASQFTVSAFDCSETFTGNGIHECYIQYNSNVNARVVFLFVNYQGNVVNAPIPYAFSSQNTAGAAFDCNSQTIPSGTYHVSYRVYELSDKNMENEITWSNPDENKHLACK